LASEAVFFLKKKITQKAQPIAFLGGFIAEASFIQVMADSARARLLRELKEWGRDSSLVTVFAAPCEDDIFEWHANLVPPEGFVLNTQRVSLLICTDIVDIHHSLSHPSFLLPLPFAVYRPYKGMPFHVIVSVPHEYPQRPPAIRLSAAIPHPNVRLCMFV
jgi:hypothetical protein